MSASRFEAYKRCSDAGMTLKEAAKALGITLFTMRQAAKKYELLFKGYNPQPPLDLIALNNSYRAAVAEGLTAEEAAQRFGVLPATARRRAHQLGIRFVGQRQPLLRDCDRSCPNYAACKENLRQWDGVLCEKGDPQ